MKMLIWAARTAVTQRWQRRVIYGVKVGAGAPQVSYGQGVGCADELGLETRGAHHGASEWAMAVTD